LKPSEGRATSSRLHPPPFTRTVRFRLTVWYSSLLLVFGVAFVVALNLAVRLDQPQVTYTLESVNATEWVAVQQPDGGTTLQQVVQPRILLKEAEDQIFSANLDQLRTWSLFAVVGLALASGVGGYVVSGMLLRPVRDITEAASEISVRNLTRRINHQGPEDELKQLADTFDSMISRIENAFESQRRFVQDASHELRTPLAAIRTNIEVAEMDAEISEQEYRSLLETVKSQTDRLTRLSEDLLLLTTNELDTTEGETVELAPIVREVIAQLSHSAIIKEVHLAAGINQELSAFGSSDLLYRCVFNLTDNAIKYSGEGSKVDVRVLSEGGNSVIQVADNGVGIPAEALGHVFERFYRVDKGRSRSEGGTGLGLAIVRELVQMMGGSVSVESKQGQGTVFSIRLRAASPESFDRDTSTVDPLSAHPYGAR
jgi:signal transduction histidine kinase